MPKLMLQIFALLGQFVHLWEADTLRKFPFVVHYRARNHQQARIDFIYISRMHGIQT